MKKSTEELNREYEIESLLNRILHAFQGAENGFHLVDALEQVGHRQETIDAITLGIKRCLIGFVNNLHFVSELGRDKVKNAKSKYYFADGSNVEFRGEVLSGMDCFGDETEIENAALDKKGPPKFNGTHVLDDMVDAIAEIREFAAKNGILTETCIEYMKLGRVGYCRGNDNNDRHIGYFYKNGSGYRSICRECMRRK